MMKYKLFGYWTLFIALSISIVAAYYSIVGLAVIFAAAIWPVIIMGTVLEIAKITTAVWLHFNWHLSPTIMKIYLTSATIILMLITSMGIYGFLSKAHIEQTAIGLETRARLDQIDASILNRTILISNLDKSIEELSSRESTQVADINAQIDREQDRIDLVIRRTQPSIDEQNNIIEMDISNSTARLVPIRDEILRIESRIVSLNDEKNNINNEQVNDTISDVTNSLNELIDHRDKLMNLLTSSDRNNIVELQRLLNITVDGRLGPETRNAYNIYMSRLDADINRTEQRIISEQSRLDTALANSNARIQSINDELVLLSELLASTRERYENELNKESIITANARREISRIREQLELQINASNQLINSLRDRLSAVTSTTINDEISSLQISKQTLQQEIDEFELEKFQIESDIRKLEAEIGPIKYIAELIYDNTDSEILETAVRLVILMLIFVFDPLAIVLVIAGLFMLSNPRDISNNSSDENIQHSVDIASDHDKTDIKVNNEVNDVAPTAIMDSSESEFTSTEVQTPIESPVESVESSDVINKYNELQQKFIDNIISIANEYRINDSIKNKPYESVKPNNIRVRRTT